MPPKTPKPGNKIGMTKLGDRAIATATPPSDQVGTGANRYQAYTYFTKVPVPGEQPTALYNGDRLWARVTLTLETAGPVAVGQSTAITPVLSGKGQLLPTNEPRSFDISRGNRLYIAATAVNRVAVSVQPLPWMEQIVALLTSLGGRVGGAVSGAVSKIFGSQ